MKKLLVFMMTLLMVLTMTGCGDPKEPEIKEPEIVALTEEGALEVAKAFPVEYYGLKTTLEIYDEKSIIYLFNIMGMDEKVEDGEVKIAVTDLQAKIDTLYGKDRFDVATLLADFIVDGNLVQEYTFSGFYTEVTNREFSVEEVKENYILVKEARAYIIKNDEQGNAWDMTDDFYYVIYATVDGLKVWDFAKEGMFTYPEQ